MTNRPMAATPALPEVPGVVGHVGFYANHIRHSVNTRAWETAPSPATVIAGSGAVSVIAGPPVPSG